MSSKSDKKIPLLETCSVSSDQINSLPEICLLRVAAKPSLSFYLSYVSKRNLG
jgi:hypothetical protein